MKMVLAELLGTTLYLLALVNPVSKVLVLASVEPALSWPQLRSVALRSTRAALLIVWSLAIAGNFLLRVVFHVDLYSLRIAGGIVLFIVGLNAVRQGRFFEAVGAPSADDISIIPLAAPLIAGPGTITAAISYAALSGIPFTLLCLGLALLANLGFMLAALPLHRLLERLHATGPLIRITGLIVMAVAVQMTLAGCSEWLLRTLAASH